MLSVLPWINFLLDTKNQGFYAFRPVQCQFKA